MQKNQKAITSGLEDFAMLQQLPETSAQTSKLPVGDKPTMMEKSPIFQSNLDSGFSSDEMQTLMAYNLYAPSDVLIAVKDKKLDWDDYSQRIKEILKKLEEKKVVYQKAPRQRKKMLKK